MKTVPKNTLKNDRRRLLRSIKKIEAELCSKKPAFISRKLFLECQLKMEKEILEYSKKFPLAIKKKNLPIVWYLLAETKGNLILKHTVEDAMKKVHLGASKKSLNNLRRKTERAMDKAWALTHTDFDGNHSVIEFKAKSIGAIAVENIEAIPDIPGIVKKTHQEKK